MSRDFIVKKSMTTISSGETKLYKDNSHRYKFLILQDCFDSFSLKMVHQQKNPPTAVGGFLIFKWDYFESASIMILVDISAVFFSASALLEAMWGVR